MIKVNNKTITEYGKSMYGGWYANYFDESKGEYNGISENTLHELCAKLQVSATALRNDVTRYDN